MTRNSAIYTEKAQVKVTHKNPVQTIVGNLGADPIIQYSAAGKPWTRARVAVTTWDPETRTKSEPEWWDVVAFGDLAENMCDHLKKGNQVIAMGRCERNEYGPKMVANEVGENMRFMFKASK